MLRKYKENTDREFATVYFNSTTKTVVAPKYSLDKSSQEVFHRIDNWISERSDWIIESIDAQYANVFIYSPLSGCSYIELKNSNKVRLILKTITINAFFGVILDP